MLFKYEIISSSSKGNCAVYHDKIMVDCGVPFSSIEHIYKNIELLLITHRHTDHFNIATIKRLLELRPSLKLATHEDVALQLYKNGVSNVLVIESGKTYHYDNFVFIPISVNHDVPNVGFKIGNKKTKHKLLHLTDASDLEDIVAINYDAYFIEMNYSDELIHDIIREKQERGEFAYEVRAIQNHLSFEEVELFLLLNAREDSLIYPMHVSGKFLSHETILGYYTKLFGGSYE